MLHAYTTTVDSYRYSRWQWNQNSFDISLWLFDFVEQMAGLPTQRKYRAILSKKMAQIYESEMTNNVFSMCIVY